MTCASSSPDPNKAQWATNLPCKKGACGASHEEKKEFKIKWDPLCLFAPRASKCRTSRNGDDSQPARLRRATFRSGALNDPRRPPKTHVASRINIDLMSLLYAKAIQIRNIWDENKVLSVYALSQRYP